MSGRLLPLAALLLAAPAAAQFYPSPPPQGHSGWPPLTLRVLPTEQIGYPFDATGEHAAPDGDFRGLYLEIDHAVSSLTRINFDLLWPSSLLSQTTGVWMMYESDLFGPWQMNECFAIITVIHYNGTSEKIFEAPTGSAQGHFWLSFDWPDDPPLPGEQATIQLKTSSPSAGHPCPVVFLIDQMLEDLRLIPIANEPEPSASAPITLTAYPNPLRADATFTLTLARLQPVRVALYDLLGREVSVLHEGTLPSGSHQLALDATALPAGVYVARAVGTEAIASRTVTVVR